MEEYDVDLSGLQQMADHFCTCDYPYFEELREAMKLLRHTGCRVTEIFDISRWAIVSDYQVRFQPQKLNNYRYLTLTSEFNNFKNAIAGQYAPFLGRTVSQLQNLFKRVNIWGNLQSGDKPISLYLFRYLFIRNLEKDGLTGEQIANVMGYTSTHVISNYLGAEIISPKPVEPAGVVVGAQTWQPKNLAVDDGGGGILAYDNDESLVSIYGRLYSYDAAVRVASSIGGWHLPTVEEMSEMINYLGGMTEAGGAMKEVGTDHWNSPNTGATGVAGLSVRGAGFAYNSDYFKDMKRNCTFWAYTPSSGSSASAYRLFSYSPAIPRYELNKTTFYSVRLVKD